MKRSEMLGELSAFVEKLRSIMIADEHTSLSIVDAKAID